MKDKCRFCGAPESIPWMSQYKKWSCGTSTGLNESIDRHKDCYESQLAQCQERLAEAERLIKGLLQMADEAMAAWSFAATHGIGLVDEKMAQEKDKLKEDARDFLGVKP